jgi:DNA invertase Pin-like site-specific DNA recombinase
MASQQRSNNPRFSQEPAQTIIRVALYARVSTLNNQDPEMQLRELREYSGRRGWQVTEEYIDQGVSGCKESRPALNQLMSDACRRRFDAILVWKIDRFGRSLKHLVNSLAELAALGVAFVSLRDNLDLSTPSGRLMFQIIGAMAEFERALIQERVKAGLRNAKAKGVRLGRPRVFVSESRIEALRASGTPWRAIAKELGVGIGTARRASQSRAKNLCAGFGTGIEESDYVL